MRGLHDHLRDARPDGAGGGGRHPPVRGQGGAGLRVGEPARRARAQHRAGGAVRGAAAPRRLLTIRHPAWQPGAAPPATRGARPRRGVPRCPPPPPP
ncbi:hypothetical protein SBRY_120136 [Actinacidiphila bryophytorum]|uniref:Uncharacterized protein n=1 Tax=Actinacidiphila bryophytorum TaxID=1436133 RepID=A0A9W4E8C7_9ACTN|nr:hypothetical protein SBRY_120136 [Actinacidiphila bryophytorum]